MLQIELPSTSFFAAGTLEMIQAATSTPTVVAITSWDKRGHVGRYDGFPDTGLTNGCW